MIEDVYRSIKLNIYERAVSPLFGSIVVTWSIWNYRFLMILFSDLTIREKFMMFDTLIFPDLTRYFLTSGAVYPIISAIFFIIIFPIPAYQAYRLSSYFNSKLRLLREKYLDESQISKKIFDKYILESNKEQETLQNSLASKDSQLGELRSEIEQLNSTLSNLQTRLTSESENATSNTQSVEGSGNDKIKLEEISLSNSESLTLEFVDREQPVTDQNLSDYISNDLGMQDQERINWIINSLLSKKLIELNDDCMIIGVVGKNYLQRDDGIPYAEILADASIEKLLLSENYRFYFNPATLHSKSKLMSFQKFGIIINGQNDNESSWQANQGYLEFLNGQGNLHNRFRYADLEKTFYSTNDESAGALTKHKIRDQYLVAESADKNLSLKPEDMI